MKVYEVLTVSTPDICQNSKVYEAQKYNKHHSTWPFLNGGEKVLDACNVSLKFNWFALKSWARENWKMQNWHKSALKLKSCEEYLIIDHKI